MKEVKKEAPAATEAAIKEIRQILAKSSLTYRQANDILNDCIVELIHGIPLDETLDSKLPTTL